MVCALGPLTYAQSLKNEGVELVLFPTIDGGLHDRLVPNFPMTTQNNGLLQVQVRSGQEVLDCIAKAAVI